MPEEERLYSSALALCITLVSPVTPLSFPFLLPQHNYSRPALHDNPLIFYAHNSRGLLLTFENGSKSQSSTNLYTDTTQCVTISLYSISTLIEALCNMLAPIDKQQNKTTDIAIMPPFQIYLTYKTASLLTRKIQLSDPDIESSLDLQKLGMLRRALRVMARRWLISGPYPSTQSINRNKRN